MANKPWNRRAVIPEDALHTQLERASQCGWSMEEYLSNIQVYLADRLDAAEAVELGSMIKDMQFILRRLARFHYSVEGERISIGQDEET